MEEFTDAVVFAVGGWNPRFDRVLAKAVVGTQAAAIIEANGVDRAVTDENLDRFTWIDGAWRSGTSGSCGKSGRCDGLAYAWGNAPAGETVTVSFSGKEHKVEVEPSGFWLFAALSADFDPSADWEDLPRQIN